MTSPLPPGSPARRALAAAVAASLALGAMAPPLQRSAFAQAAPPAAIALPSLGDEASEDFSVIAEARLGERIMREVRRDPAYLDDPELLEYLQTLWQPLLAAARRKGEISAELDARFAWEVFLVRDRSVNAFALPGSTVGVHLGLITITQTPDELASVLAHELSHVTQRHIARSFSNSRRQSMLALAGLILGVLAASRSNSIDGMNAAIVGSQAAGVQGQLNFSREAEREADRVGFAVMTQAGFAPLGMAAMFERLQTASRLNDSGGFPYLRTHPLTGERIAEARARVGLGALAGGAPGADPSLGSVAGSAGDPSSAGSPARPAAAPPAEPSLSHALAVARARVLADPRDEPLDRWAAQAGASGAASGAAARTEPSGTAWVERIGIAYSAALAASMRRDPSRAQAALREARALLAAAPSPGRGASAGSQAAAQRSLALLAAELAVARGDGAAALAELAPFLNGPRALSGPGGAPTPTPTADASPTPTAAPTAPGSIRSSRVMLLRHTEAVLAWADAPAPALRERGEALQIWLSAHPGDAMAWLLASQVWRRLDQPLRAVRAEAEARYALGDLTGASDRLRAGQQAARQTPLDAVDGIEAAVIDTRLREVDELRRQIFLEERGGQFR